MGEWIISSSILIVLIILIRGLCKDKIGLGARYALWFVVAVRLLVPVSFSESSLSVLNLLEWEKAAADQWQQAFSEAEGRLSGKPAELEAFPVRTPQEREQEENTDSEPGGILPDRMESVSGSYQDEAGFAESVSGSSPGEAGFAGNVPMEFPDGSGSVESAPGGFRRGTEAGNGQNPGEEAEADREYRTGSFPWRKALTGIWLAGAVLSGGIVLLVNGEYRRRVYFSRRKCRLPLESRLPAYISPAVETPCMFGLMSPAIYLTPGIERNEKKLRYVLYHENTHFRHHDNLWTLVRVVCLCVHWYNPLVWAAAAMSRQDCELACDEETLKLLGEEERIGYGRALLDFSIQGDTLLNGLQLSTAVAGGKKHLKERLMMIVGQPRRHPGALTLVLSLTLLVSMATFTGKVNGQEAGDNAWGKEQQGISLDMDGNSGSTAGENGAFREGSGDILSTEEYVESTSIVSLDLGDGRDYTLKLGGEAAAKDGECRGSRLELNWLHDRVEENVQTIELEKVRVLYTRPAGENGNREWSAPGQEPLFAKPLYTAMEPAGNGSSSVDRDGRPLTEISGRGIFVEDLNFDGYVDFYLQGSGQGANVPCYCYLWNPVEKQFEPGYMIPNLRVNREEELLESATTDEDDQYSVKYYRFDQDNCLHMLRYTEENQSPEALFPTLDLTYCETGYSLPAVDEWDYGTVIGGALTERLIYWAKQALTELYEMTGTKLDTICFAVTSFGDISFGRTPSDLEHSRTFYDRAYGERAGFEGCIEHFGLSTERTVWFSPVILWRVPENLDKMTDLELAEWYFGRIPLSRGEVLESIEPWMDGFLIRAESGNYYEIFLQPVTRELSSAYGPYDTCPNN